MYPSIGKWVVRFQQGRGAKGKQMYYNNEEAELQVLLDRLEKNLEKYVDTRRRIGGTLDLEPLTLSRTWIGDILYQISDNNNQIHIPRGPVFIMGNQRYSAKAWKFDKIEDVIEHFSGIHNSQVGIFQIFVNRIMEIENFHHTTSIIVRYDTDFFIKNDGENINSFLRQVGNGQQSFCKKILPDFLSKEEMTLI